MSRFYWHVPASTWLAPRIYLLPVNRMLMNYSIAKVTHEQRRYQITKKHLSALIIIFSFTIFVGIHWNFFFDFWGSWDKFKAHTQHLPFSISLAAVALIIAGAYYYAYRFFGQNFYFYLCVSWVANAVYLLPEKNGPPPDWSNQGQVFSYKIGVLTLSLIPTAFMVLALMSQGEKKKDQLKWRNIIIAIDRSAWRNIFIGGVAGIALDVFVLMYVASSPQDRTDVNLGWWLFPGSVISFVILCAVGDNLKAHLTGIDDKRKARIAMTFYIYGTLQFIYPLTPLIKDERLLSIPFLVAQMLKVINAILMMGSLQAARDKEIETINKELADKEKKLESQSRLVDLGILAASIKHDINTPLATMGSHIDAIKNKFSKNTELVKKMDKLDQSITRISAIANIVDIIRGDNNFMDREALMVKAEMLGIVESAVELVKKEKIPLIGNTIIKTKGQKSYVRALVPLLEQMLVNIIKNGLEAIVEAKQENGLINIYVNTIKVQDSKYSRWVKVEITDNGCGIPEEHMEKLATGFTTRGEKKPNSGIGLSTGKRIIGIHGGKVDFTSKIGEGTTVTILLPEWYAFQKAAKKSAESIFIDDDPSVDHEPADVLETETTYSLTSEISKKIGETK